MTPAAEIGFVGLGVMGQTGVDPRGARLARDTLQRSSAAGQGGVYFPALVRLIAGRS